MKNGGKKRKRLVWSKRCNRLVNKLQLQEDAVPFLAFDQPPLKLLAATGAKSYLLFCLFYRRYKANVSNSGKRFVMQWMQHSKQKGFCTMTGSLFYKRCLNLHIFQNFSFHEKLASLGWYKKNKLPRRVSLHPWFLGCSAGAPNSSFPVLQRVIEVWKVSN